jgi:prepilin-type N-terminal cleavage/methylation domain-containing protein/prepilin-type processing-associated H-X9-DG protein
MTMPTLPMKGRTTYSPGSRGFTLIELLVVIAIIALLISILLPALGKARESGRQIKAAASLRSVGQAVNIYVTSNEFFPPSYVYADGPESNTWRLRDQLDSNPTPANGYIHWSFSLFDTGAAPADAFKNPGVIRGGAPASNPGRNPDDWENWQVNDLGQRAPAALPDDRQVPRVGITGNAAIFPRNKFAATGRQRRNQLVQSSWIDSSQLGPAGTILAGEFAEVDGWRSIATNANVSKSHRSVTPFQGISSGANVYDEPDLGTAARFEYPALTALDRELSAGAIDSSTTTLNAIGRHWSGKKDEFGGSANFVFVDGHVETMTIAQSIRDRKWGDRFFSITGPNRVDLDANRPPR